MTWSLACSTWFSLAASLRSLCCSRLALRTNVSWESSVAWSSCLSSVSTCVIKKNKHVILYYHHHLFKTPLFAFVACILVQINTQADLCFCLRGHRLMIFWSYCSNLEHELVQIRSGSYLIILWRRPSGLDLTQIHFCIHLSKFKHLLHQQYSQAAGWTMTGIVRGINLIISIIQIFMPQQLNWFYSHRLVKNFKKKLISNICKAVISIYYVTLTASCSITKLVRKRITTVELIMNMIRGMTELDRSVSVWVSWQSAEKTVSYLKILI